MTDYLAMKPMYYLGNQSDTLFMYRLSQYERGEYYINKILDLRENGTKSPYQFEALMQAEWFLMMNRDTRNERDVLNEYYIPVIDKLIEGDRYVS